MLHMLHMSDMLKEKDIRRKSNGFELLPPPAGGPPPSRREVFGVENRRSVECRREIATVRCVCNAGLHHCNGQMYLQPSVAPPTPVWARIARPFIPDVIITLRAGARRVIGATAKPLYPIDGKAVGLDRRSPSRPPSSREGDRPQTVEGVRTPCVERRSRPPSSRKNLFQTSYASYASYARHISGI